MTWERIIRFWERITRYFEERKWRFLDNLEKHALEGNLGEILEEMFSESDEAIEDFVKNKLKRKYVYAGYVYTDIYNMVFDGTSINIKENINAIRSELDRTPEGFCRALYKLLFFILDKKIGKMISDLYKREKIKSIKITPLTSVYGCDIIIPRFVKDLNDTEIICDFEDSEDHIEINLITPWKENLLINLYTQAIVNLEVPLEKGDNMSIKLFGPYTPRKRKLSFKFSKEDLRIDSSTGEHSVCISTDKDKVETDGREYGNALSLILSKNLEKVLLVFDKGKVIIWRKDGFDETYLNVRSIGGDLYIWETEGYKFEIAWDGRIYFPESLKDIKIVKGKKVPAPSISAIVDGEYINIGPLSSLIKEIKNSIEEKRAYIVLSSCSWSDYHRRYFLYLSYSIDELFGKDLFSMKEITDSIINKTLIYPYTLKSKKDSEKAKEMFIDLYKLALSLKCDYWCNEYKRIIKKYLERMGVDVKIEEKIERDWELFYNLVSLAKLLEDAYRRYKFGRYNLKRYLRGKSMEEVI